MKSFQKILVTGGAGFIGSHFVDLCLNKHIKILNFDALKKGSLLEHGPRKKHKDYIFSYTDISNPDFALPDGIDVVVHFAAETHVDRSVTDPHSFVQSNIIGTYNLAKKCAEKNVWLHLVSTDEVYGDVIHKSTASLETDAIHSSSPYSASKASAEQIVMSWGRTYGLNYTITRGCNTVGARQNKEKLLPKFIHNAKNNLPLPVYGDGKAIRQYLHVSDHAEAIFQVLSKADSGTIWNVCADYSCSINEIVEIVREKYPLISINHNEDRPGHDLKYNIDNSNILKLGFSPTVTGVDIIKQSICELEAEYRQS